MNCRAMTHGYLDLEETKALQLWILTMSVLSSEKPVTSVYHVDSSTCLGQDIEVSSIQNDNLGMFINHRQDLR